jgi:hypothetical protein
MISDQREFWKQCIAAYPAIRIIYKVAAVSLTDKLSEVCSLWMAFLLLSSNPQSASKEKTTFSGGTRLQHAREKYANGLSVTICFIQGLFETTTSSIHNDKVLYCFARDQASELTFQNG